MSYSGDYDPYLDGFTREVVEEFARVGIYPPPYAGDARDPESVLLGLAFQERWRDPPSLLGSDDEGVKRQMLNFQWDVTRGMALMDQPRDPQLWGSYHRC